MAKESPVHKIVSATIQEAQGRPTIIFCVTKDHAELTCEICQRHPGVTAEFVTDDTDTETRREIIKRFRAGTTQIFCNVGIATEGFDARVDVVAVARPTKSEALYRQMIGRGTRNAPGKKECTVLDLAGNGVLHGSIYDREIYDLNGKVESTESRTLTPSAASGEAEKYEHNQGEELKEWKPQPKPIRLIENLHRLKSKSPLHRLRIA
jgi:superfamily II DNA or RNA helicase